MTKGLILFFAILIFSGSGYGQEKKITVFHMPGVNTFVKRISAHIYNENIAEAQKAIDEFKNVAPQRPEGYYLNAMLFSTQGNVEAGHEELKKAISYGTYTPEELEQNYLLDNLKSGFAWQRLKEACRVKGVKDRKNKLDVAAIPILSGKARVMEKNTFWNKANGYLQSFFTFDPKVFESLLVISGNDQLATDLNTCFRVEQCAGNIGDLYDNRDRKHSSLSSLKFPQLSFIAYSSQAEAADVDLGANRHILFNAITVGNSSTQISIPSLSRSHQRYAQTTPNGMAMPHMQYTNNHLYFYPAVGDYSEENGDLFPANTPHFIASKGRSGSERELLAAAIKALASFKPSVKDVLRKKRLVSPTLQYLFRNSILGVENKEDYLSAKAHPAVFEASKVNVKKLSRIAREMDIKTIPPLIGLKVMEESGWIYGVDGFAQVSSEVLFDTPNSIARVIRSTAYEKRMQVALASSLENHDAMDAKVHWIVLSGDEKRIQIKKLDEIGFSVEITVPWHGEKISTQDPEIFSRRVEIAAFVESNGVISAPAFVNFHYPIHQHREYDENGKLLKIDHQDPEKSIIYADPLLFPKRDWEDQYKYDDNGKLVGWTRIREKAGATPSISHYDSVGRKLLSGTDKVHAVEYSLVKGEDNYLHVQEKPVQ